MRCMKAGWIRRGKRGFLAGAAWAWLAAAAGEPVVVVEPSQVPVGGSFTARVEGAPAGSQIRWQAGRNAQLQRIDSIKRQATFKALAAPEAGVAATLGEKTLNGAARVGPASAQQGPTEKPGAVANPVPPSEPPRVAPVTTNAATDGARGVSRAEGREQAPAASTCAKDVPSSTSDQVVEMGSGVKVTVPPGALGGPGKLTVRPAPDFVAAGEADFSFKKLASFEIALGDRNTFSNPLTIEVPFDPKRLNPGYTPGQQIVARRWDEAGQKWIYLASQVDKDRNLVRTSTDHLTLIEWITIAVVVVAVDAAHGVYEDHLLDHYGAGRFFIIYDKKAIRSETLLADQVWGKFQGGGLSGAPKTLVTRPDMFPDAVPVKGATLPLEPLTPPQLEDVPLFIRDLGAALEDACTSYGAAGFDEPDVPITVKVDSAFIGQLPASGAFEKFFKRIHIRTDFTGTMDKLKLVSAHELFHAFQFQALGFQGMNQLSAPQKTWWLESTADYAAARVAWKALAGMMGAKKEGKNPYPRQLEYKLSHVGSPDGKICDLEYDKAWFIDYATRNGVDFIDMFKAVTPGKDTDPVERLDQYLAGRTGRGLADWYQRFAVDFLLSRESPIAGVDALEHSTIFKTDPLDVSPTAPGDPREFTFGLLGRYTTQVWGLHAVDAAQAQDSPRAIEIEAERLYGPGAAFHVYLLGGNRKVPGSSLKPAVVLSSEGQKETIRVRHDDVVCLLAFNLSPEKTAIVKARVRTLGPAPEATAHYEEYYGEDPKQGKREEFDFILWPPDKFFARAAGFYGRAATDEERKESENSNAHMLMNLDGAQILKSLVRLAAGDEAQAKQWIEDIGNGKSWIFYHGAYVRYNPGGTKDYQRAFEYGMAHGDAVSYHKNGQIKEKGRFVHNKREGEWQSFDEGGRLTETALYEKDECVSRHPKSYYGDGTPCSDGPKMIRGPESHRPDLKDGPFVEYHENGRERRRGQYRQDKEIGVWQQWSKDGHLVEKRVHSDPFDPDKAIHQTVYESDGRVNEEGYWDRFGRKHGTWIETRGSDTLSIEYEHGREKRRGGK